MGISVKSEKEIEIMAEGGRKLRKIKARLKKEVQIGNNAAEIDKLAESEILKCGAKPSFKMVRGYSWTTCVNVNAGVVHGIPSKDIVFTKGDLISVDVGIYYKGFHTDTSFSVGLDLKKGDLNFLECGSLALKKAILKAKKGNRIYDISEAIESVLKKNKYSPVKALVGHGVGRELHEEPQIPCFVAGRKEDSPIIPEGACLAIEVMYTSGSGNVAIKNDGWTIVTRDDKISALFEETVAITKYGPIILTYAGLKANFIEI